MRTEMVLSGNLVLCQISKQVILLQNCNYTVSQEKMCHTIVAIISSNFSQFSKLFHCWKVCSICNKTVYNITHHT